MTNVADLSPRIEERGEMVSLLNAAIERVNNGETTGLLVIEVKRNLQPTKIHNAGHIQYADMIGQVWMALMDLWARAAGVVDP